MLDISTIDNDVLTLVKRHLKITWADNDTDLNLWQKICDAEAALNHQLGAEIDYFSAAGLERSLFLAYVLYDFNDCLNDFVPAYLGQILTLRHKYIVAGADENEK